MLSSARGRVLDGISLPRDVALGELAGVAYRYEQAGAGRRVVCSHVLEPHLGSPRRARALLRRACLDWAVGNAYDDAALVVTELVTNAVRHAGTPCRLTITLDGDGLHVAVRDRGPLHPALLDDRQRGAGLHVVSTLVQRWGVVPHADGKTVWARFPPRQQEERRNLRPPCTK